MEEKGIKILALIPIIIVITVLGITAFLVYKKFFYVQPTPPVVEEKKDVSILMCNKWTNIEYKKYEELKLKYSEGQIYEFEILYQYTYRLSHEKDKVRNDMKTILNTEKKYFTNGFTGKFETTKEGGNVDMIYDLSDQLVRLYVNNKYYHNNMYLNKTDLAKYMTDNGYNCAEEKLTN